MEQESVNVSYVQPDVSTSKDVVMSEYNSVSTPVITRRVHPEEVTTVKVETRNNGSGPVGNSATGVQDSGPRNIPLIDLISPEVTSRKRPLDGNGVVFTSKKLRFSRERDDPEYGPYAPNLVLLNQMKKVSVIFGSIEKQSMRVEETLKCVQEMRREWLQIKRQMDKSNYYLYKGVKELHQMLPHLRAARPRDKSGRTSDAKKKLSNPGAPLRVSSLKHSIPTSERHQICKH